MSSSQPHNLFDEEESMVSMSVGDHIEELRSRMIYGLFGLFIGVFITFIPPMQIGQWVALELQEPADRALSKYRAEQASLEAEARQEQISETAVPLVIEAYDLAKVLAEIYPEQMPTPDPEALADQQVVLPTRPYMGELTEVVEQVAPKTDSLISTGPLEAPIIYFFVCLITGLVISSPWVFYQGWAFVAAGLYRQERAYVYRFLPFSLGLFLGGVALCFFLVLPTMIDFLLFFNSFIGTAPLFRVREWMSFATFLPLVFGICFQTPLVMLFLERVGIFRLEDFQTKRKYAIFIIFVIAALITPSPDGFSQLMLGIPMVLLYELGIILIRSSVMFPRSARTGW